MFKIYLLTAWRNLKKNKLVSFINILGLSIGLACALLAILFAWHELTYEKYHEKADRICRIYLAGDLGVLNWTPNTDGPEGPDLKNMFPEIEKNALLRSITAIVRIGDNLFVEKEIAVADTTIYSIFTIPFREGKPENNPNSIVLSEKTAQKYFGNVSPIGKLLTITCFDQKLNMTITGIFRDFPSNTHTKADFIIPFSIAKQFKWRYTEHYSTDYSSYVLLKPGTNIEVLNNKIAKSYKIPIHITGIKAWLLPIKQIHYRGSFENNYMKLLAFLIGGFLVLITSSFNYINLSNILFSTRIKEIGIRIVNGGRRKFIFFQLLIDTALSAGIGFGIALLALYTLLPWFNATMDTHITLGLTYEFIGSIAGLYVLTILISGIYPALKYSSSKPIRLFRQSMPSTLGKNRSLWILTSIQFLFAVLTIQMMMVMDKQSKHLNDVNIIGYDAKDVICLPGNQWGNLKNVKTELLKNPAITAVSWGSHIPSTGLWLTEDWKDEDNKEPAIQLRAEYDYLKVFGIKMLSGRFFSDEFQSDNEDGIVINKKTVNAINLKDPVGKTMYAYDKQYRILGVVDNYQATPPIFNDMPQLIRLSGEQNDNLFVRVNPQHRNEAHEYIRATLHKFNPDYPVDIKYHQEKIYDMAKSYVTTTQLMNMFFIIAILTALFGLFGLSVFIAERHRKEVGIRKVCGATICEIILKLVKNQAYQVLLAIGIATPIAFMISQKYLSMFPRHCEPGIFLYLQGGFLALFLMLLAVSWQSWRAATRNPVETLRYE